MTAAGSARRLVVLLLALATAGIAHSRMDTRGREEADEVFVPRPAQARASTLGFDALAADYYWLQAVQVVGRARRDLGDHNALMAHLIDVVTALDPWVGHPYRFAAVWLTHSVEEVRHANRLLERAVAYHPRDWRNRHYLGFNHFFYLGDDERAAEWLESTLGLPKTPRYMGGLVAKLRLERDGLETSASFLASLAESTEDPYAHAEYLKALDEIETERRARRLDAAREAYRRRTGRDIERVEDLVEGPGAVLAQLPQAHPHFTGFRWRLDESGRIVSSFYRKRYEPHVNPSDRGRRERWRAAIEAGKT